MVTATDRTHCHIAVLLPYSATHAGKCCLSVAAVFLPLDSSTMLHMQRPCNESAALQLPYSRTVQSWAQSPHGPWSPPVVVLNGSKHDYANQRCLSDMP